MLCDTVKDWGLTHLTDLKFMITGSDSVFLFSFSTFRNHSTRSYKCWRYLQRCVGRRNHMECANA